MKQVDMWFANKSETVTAYAEAGGSFGQVRWNGEVESCVGFGQKGLG